jgi:chromate transporter
MKKLWEIFVAFAGVGALTFGGGYTMLPLLEKQIAVKRKWVTLEEIMEYYAIAASLPGIIAVNTAMMVGHKQKGLPGLLAAALGMIFPSVVIILIIASFIQPLMAYDLVRHAFNGIRAAVLALIVDAVIKMWKSGVKDKTGIVFFAVTLAAFTFFNISPVIPLIAGAVCGIIIKERKTK